MSILSPAEIKAHAIQAGFSEEQARTFTAIALAESGGNTDAHNPSGEDSWGLWQININPSVRANTWGDLTDPAVNARAAYEISNHGQNLRPWTVTHDSVAGTDRDYRTYLPQVPGADTAVAPPPTAGTDTVDAPVHLGPTADYVQPIEGAKLSDSWGAPRSGGRTHQGIDIMAPEGTPIHAVHGGTVVQGFENDLGGVVVRIEGDDGRYYYYAHMLGGSVDHLQVGQHIDTGDVIGAVSNTGNARGGPTHLHFGVKENGNWVNPYPFLQDLPDAPATDGDVMLGGPDADHDGLPDYDEIARGSDPHSPDSDHDGILDGVEVTKLHTDPLKLDTDADNLSDAYEVGVSHTNPALADSDADGIRDDLELGQGSDPTRGTKGAGLIHIAPGTPGADLDDDHDNLSNAYEVALGTDPNNADSDFDAVSDSVEVAEDMNPLSADSDGDGLTDRAELDFGTDPLVPDFGLDEEPSLGDDLGSGPHARVAAHALVPGDDDLDDDDLVDP
jgi:murein DD-endopeptidase MepM/ murein hydrolase activator NlpD